MSLLSNVVVPKWFNKKRALALSIVSVGSVVGSTFIPPINTFINNTIGWRTTWFIWAGALLLIFVPVILLFLKNKPKDVGLEVDNQRLTKEEKIEEKQKGIENDWELSEALKTRTFWFMAISTAIPAFINTGLFFHLYSIIESNGLNESTAAIILSLYGALSFIFSFVAGYVLDRIKVRYVLVVSFIVQFLNIILLINATSVILAIIFGINLGIIAGFQRVSRKVIWPNYYGKKALGSISGFTMTTLVIGTSLSPLIIGASYDYFKGYSEVLIFIAGFTILGALLAFVSPKPKGRLSNE
jgi:predicted MFS family arabinose efflux permease